MKKDKLKVCILELLLIIFLFFALIASNIITRIILSVTMSIFMILSLVLLKVRKTSSIYKKQVTIIMIIFSLIYIGVFYLMGLYFGFEHSKILLSINSIFKIIIPLSIIIISTEVIRRIFLSQEVNIRIKTKNINISLIMTYIITILVDLVIYMGIYDLTKLDDFLMALGFVFFASLSCNLLYNYISIRYGSKGIIIYRLITTLFIYIIPVIPSMYVFFKSFLRMLYPYIIYLILEKIFSKSDFSVSRGEKKKNIIINLVLLTTMTLLIMLISCQFRFGMLVVGSRSMTGTINKGDAIIYEKYDKQEIQKGQIIIFNYNDFQTIHRVVNIKEVNNEIRYYTKGDANKELDDDYITDKEINGLVKLRVKYIGYPTLWFRSIFK